MAEKNYGPDKVQREVDAIMGEPDQQKESLMRDRLTRRLEAVGWLGRTDLAKELGVTGGSSAHVVRGLVGPMVNSVGEVVGETPPERKPKRPVGALLSTLKRKDGTQMSVLDKESDQTISERSDEVEAALAKGDFVKHPVAEALGKRNPDYPDSSRIAYTPEQIEAMIRYTGAGDRALSMNSALRSGEKLKGEEKVIGELLEEAFSRTPEFANPIHLVRGLSKIGKKDIPFFVDSMEKILKSGDPMILPGMISTSTGKIPSGFRGPVVFNIEARHGLDMREFSSRSGGQGRGDVDEREVLLNHNSLFRLNGYKIEKGLLGVGQKRLVVSLTQLSDDGRPLSGSILPRAAKGSSSLVQDVFSSPIKVVKESVSMKESTPREREDESFFSAIVSANAGGFENQVAVGLDELRNRNQPRPENQVELLHFARAVEQHLSSGLPTPVAAPDPARKQ